MNNTAITTIDQTPKQMDPYTPESFEQVWEMANIIVKSRLHNVSTPEQAVMIMALGSDMGLSVMQSLRGIHVIEGKASPSADCLVAMALRSGLAEYVVEVETTDTHSTWETKRKGGKARQSTFTIEDAEKALLTKRGKDPSTSNWAKYPRRMLAARAKAFLVRDVYPDLALGLYIPDEIQAEDRPMRVEIEAEINARAEVGEPVDASFYDADQPRGPLGQPAWRVLLDRCDTVDELKTMSRRCVDEGVPAADVRIAFNVRLAELSK